MDKLQEAMNFRTAVKEFDTSKKVTDEDLKYILEAGILAPSSFGLEHWKFRVYSSAAHKAEISPICFDQKQIITASHVIVIIGKIHEFHEDSQYIKDIVNERMPPEISEYMQKVIGQFTTSMSDDQLKSWVQKQCYIAASHMMTAAAFKQIDSCPMEGFKEKELLNYMGLNPQDYTIALVLPIGYRVEEPKNSKTRLPFEDLVEIEK